MFTYKKTIILQILPIVLMINTCTVQLWGMDKQDLAEKAPVTDPKDAKLFLINFSALFDVYKKNFQSKKLLQNKNNILSALEKAGLSFSQQLHTWNNITNTHKQNEKTSFTLEFNKVLSENLISIEEVLEHIIKNIDKSTKTLITEKSISTHGLVISPDPFPGTTITINKKQDTSSQTTYAITLKQIIDPNVTSRYTYILSLFKPEQTKKGTTPDFHIKSIEIGSWINGKQTDGQDPFTLQFKVNDTITQWGDCVISEKTDHPKQYFIPQKDSTYKEANRSEYDSYLLWAEKHPMGS